MSLPQRVVITHTSQGLFLEHDGADLTELAQTAVTLVRLVADELRQANPEAQQCFARWVAEAAMEGGVKATELEPQ